MFRGLLQNRSAAKGERCLPSLCSLNSGYLNLRRTTSLVPLLENIPLQNADGILTSGALRPLADGDFDVEASFECPGEVKAKIVRVNLQISRYTASSVSVSVGLGNCRR